MTRRKALGNTESLKLVENTAFQKRVQEADGSPSLLERATGRKWPHPTAESLVLALKELELPATVSQLKCAVDLAHPQREALITFMMMGGKEAANSALKVLGEETVFHETHSVFSIPASGQAALRGE